MSSQQQQPTRLTSRQASAQAQRRAMTERRQKLTQRIRKQKKSDWLAQKRGVVASNGETTTTPDLSQAMTDFLRHVPPTSEALQQLYTALQLASSTMPWSSLEDSSKMELAQKVVQRLDETMEHCLIHNDLTMALITVQILVQLVAMTSSPSSSYNSNNSNDQMDSYYGRQALTWSDLIVEHSNIPIKVPRILSSIPTPLTQQQQMSTISDQTWQLVEQTCWFVGNLSQEMPSSCSRFRREGNLVALLTNLLALIQQQQTTECDDKIIRTVQAAAWALHNLLKGDAAASGYEYCHCNNHAGMNPALANALLTLPVPVIQTSFQAQNSCIDISVQTAWILVHLSQREDDVVDFLLNNNTDSTSDDLVRNVLERLYQVCEGAQQQVQGAVNPLSSPGRPNYFHHPLLEPCLEVLGHWSTASNGKHVPRLMTTTPATSRVPQPLSLLSILETLLQWGQQGLLQQSDYVQALWLSGCLLCDAGIPSHPSTKIAAPSLLPLLTRGLTDNPGGNNSNSRLACKREGVVALWNAVDAPPTDDDQEPIMLLATRKYLLRLILSAASADNETVRGDALDKESAFAVLMALKNLLLCQDVDAMLASMHVLDAILRQIPSSRVIFNEVHGDEALETVCDLPLGNDQASSDAADMAAELIDDFFDSDRIDDPNDQFADPVLQPAQAGGTFVFGMDQQTAAASSAPIFMPDLLSPMGGTTSNPTGHGPAIAPVASETMASGMGRGRGRGRGHMLPAWAMQQRAQN